MPTPIPYDIQGEIVGFLPAHPQALRNLGSTSGQLNALTRPILFREVHIQSVPRLVQLSSLILTRFGTIPDHVAHLSIEIRALTRTDARHSVSEVREALAFILNHFDTIEISIALTLPWLLSRAVDWEYLNRSSQSIRKFTLSGMHSSPNNLVGALSHMTSLESLVVDASWNSIEAQWGDLPNATILPSNLKEICCSADSLDFLGWVCSLERCLQNLHIIRVKIDGINSRFASICVPPFLKKYGRELRHLYLWFKAIPWDSSVYGDIGRGAIQANLKLSQLEVFLPSLFEEEDDEEIYSDAQEEIRDIKEAICPKAHLSDVQPNIRTAYQIALNGEDFWEAPSRGQGCGRNCIIVRPVDSLV